LSQLASLVPVVSALTVWNVPDDPAGFELALRTRVAWLASQMDMWCDLEHDIVPSSGGGNWAARMWASCSAEGHFVTAEVQEGLTAYEWRPDPDRPYRDRLPGPVVLLGLRQEDVTTSADFDWSLLHRMFAAHVIDETEYRSTGAPGTSRRLALTIRLTARTSRPSSKPEHRAGLARAGG
jgi:hypothetical protein